MLHTIQSVAGALTPGSCDVCILISCPRDLETSLCRTRLFRILFNLVSNAVEAVGSRGHDTIQISVLVYSGLLMIDIRDDGPGLPTRVRDLFRGRAEENRSTNPCPGLGILVARSVSRDLGGWLSLASTGAEGTFFQLVLLDSHLPNVLPRSDRLEQVALRLQGRL